jgi:hypothetical protein
MLQTSVLLNNTVALHVLEHTPFETVTLYVPCELTLIHCVVAPVFHRFETIPAGAQSVVDPPMQRFVLPVIVQGGGFIGVIVVEQLLVQLPLVTLTEYVPAPAVIHCVVAPVLHRYESIPAGAQSCVVPPMQQERVPVIEQLTFPDVTFTLHELEQPLFVINTE